eukprot:TRINITY_DN4825_c0_g1_i1.p1 TRINITY_DN4825_c0_g1~~TRINITY_DN4825_c0_g1_i1.p1  ORF type:complete len:270 (-),score=45.27 TRINITY_DN4825_c0_g1_i1:286-1095(-)
MLFTVNKEFIPTKSSGINAEYGSTDQENYFSLCRDMSVRAFAFFVGRAISETGIALDQVGCRFEGRVSYKDDISRHQTIQSIGEHSPNIQGSSFIAPNSRVIGKVEIGSGSSIGFGSTVRADVNEIKIGNNAHVGDLVTVHVVREGLRQEGAKTNIGHNCTVGSQSLIHGATLEDGCSIGVGCTVLDGAIIGTQSQIEPGSLVLSGTRVGAKQLWGGSPATYQRGLTEADLERQKEVVKNLSKLAQKHLSWANMPESRKAECDYKQFVE